MHQPDTISDQVTDKKLEHRYPSKSYGKKIITKTKILKYALNYIILKNKIQFEKRLLLRPKQKRKH